MDRDDLRAQLLATWRRHNEILLFLLASIPGAGLRAVPLASKGRTVAEQFQHLDQVRRGWLHFHETGRRVTRARVQKGRPPSRAVLGSSLTESGRMVERFLACAIDEDVKPRMFGRQAVRWMGYLIAHESHHRGQIALALKQNGTRLPERVALQGLWGKWIFGREKP
jgi:uncharacterized damage-inducible protein DinB